MSSFNMMRMKTYLEHILIGTLAIVVSISILSGIVAEMLHAYVSDSTTAYIWGIIVCVIMFGCGIAAIIFGIRLKYDVFKRLDQEEVRQFFKEIRSETALVYDNSLIITDHFIVTFTGSFRYSIYIIRMHDLVACFGQKSMSANGALIGFRLTLVDNKFRKIEYETKGIQSSDMEEGYKALIRLSPWVFSDNYEDFMGNFKSKSKEKAYLKEIELRREHSEDHIDDTLPLNMVTAADIIRNYTEKQNQETERTYPLEKDVNNEQMKTEDLTDIL